MNPNPNSERQVLRIPSQRRQIDVVANQAILTELVKNLELTKVSLRRETPLIQVIDIPRFPLEKIGLGKSKSAVIGFLIGSLLTVVLLIVSNLYRQVLHE